MLPLYTDEDFKNAKSREKLPLKCKHCGKTFYMTKHRIQTANSKLRSETYNFCGNSCQGLDKTMRCRNLLQCEQCRVSITKTNAELRNTKHHFCSKSCSAKYRNSHKQTGTRRSKFEVWVEKQLVSLYPNLEFHFNRKDTIQSELDIYIPELKLAFEINGIFHYEPIFGQDKLDRTKKNEKGKFAACIEKDISLCIIDISTLNYFKPKKAQKFLDIITTIINQTLSPSV